MRRALSSWIITALVAAVLALTTAVAMPTGRAAAAEAEAGSPAETAAAEKPQPSASSSAANGRSAAEPATPKSAAPTRDPQPAPVPDPKQQAAAQRQAREQAAAAAAGVQARAQKRAAQLAAAGQRAQASWVSHGHPKKMVIVRQRSIDVVEDGRLTRQAPRSGGALTLATLDRFVPTDWVVVSRDSADVSAAIVLGPGQRLTLGDAVKTVRLAGGPTAADAASLYTGSGRLILRGVTIGSFDASNQQPLPVGPGRPFIVVNGGGHIEATDASINDLGTLPTDPAPRAALALSQTSTGSLVRTTLARSGIGLKLDRTDRVRLEAVTVADSAGDGLVLRGDQGTALIDVRSTGNGGNGVLVTGPSSERPITGISASGNKLFGLAMLGQTTPKVDHVATAGNAVGGIRVSASTDVAISDITATDDPIGVYTHVGSDRVVIERAQIVGARRGLHIEKTTKALTLNASSITGASVAGVSIGGHDTTLNQVSISDSATAVRVERGAAGVAINGMSMFGGSDGLVALSATKDVVLRNVNSDGVSRTAIRTFSTGLQILDSRISGGSTGVDAGAATTISNTVIDDVQEGIRSRSDDPVVVNDAVVSALSVGINVAPGSPVRLAGSHVDALEAIRGTLSQDGINELSLPPLNLLGAIGVPLILLALVLEQVQTYRQRGVARTARRLPPPLALPSP